MTSAWVVRAGLGGEQEQWNLEHGRATIGWSNLGDVAKLASREELRALVDKRFPDDSTAKRGNATGQVWAFSRMIQVGDLVVMPSKSRPGYLWLGRCTGPFAYVANESDGWPRMQLPVTWQAEPVAKSAIKDDLLNSLNAILTVFSPTRNNASARLEAVFASGTDPGSGSPVPKAVPAAEPGAVTDPPSAPTLEAIQDRIRTRIVENFGGHKLTYLVADVLEALGYVCEVSPPGPDGGIDIRAGRGPLGLDAPTIVEVKSEPGPVGVQVMSRLHSSMTKHNAQHGLLVALGGINSAARKEFETLRTVLQVWDSEVLLLKIFETYPRLSEATRAALPLKQAWVLDDESEG